MVNNRKRLWLVLMLFFYVVIAAGGFYAAYLVKNYFISKNASVMPTPTASRITPIPAPAGWKTYINPENKMQFSYPSTDHIKNSSFGFGVTNVALQNAQGDTDFQFLIIPKTLAQAVGQDFDSYYAMPDHTTKVIKSPLAQDNTTETFTKIRNRTVNGLQALDYRSLASNAPRNSLPEIGTFIVTGNNVVLISTGSENKMKLEQLLSSFTYSQ